MTAPSWSADFGMNTVRRRSAERSPWIITPLSAISSRPVSRSRTMRAPWPSADSSDAARATSVATWSVVRSSAERSQRIEPTRPIRSSARRISGWNTTTSANRPTTAPVSRIWVSSRSWSRRAAKYTTNSTLTPITRRTARVPRIRLKSQ
jgi:hypothetical protein